MERWLLLSNCQTFGLTNSFNLLHPDFEVTGVDIWAYRERRDEIHRAFPSYFRVVVHPEFLRDPAFDATLAPNLTVLPAVEFDAYHPDLCYAFGSTGMITGPTQDYQSTIAVAAYRCGLDIARTIRLFTAATYERCGYFDRWQTARARLFADFATIDMPLGHLFTRWGERRPFMYSVNHPRIEVLFDIADAFMRRLGVDTLRSDLRPADNLANGPCFPVYPEIGEALGVRGSYLFKAINAYRVMTLPEFITRSFAAFSAHPRDALHVNDESQPVLDALCGLIGERHG